MYHVRDHLRHKRHWAIFATVTKGILNTRSHNQSYDQIYTHDLKCSQTNVKVISKICILKITNTSTYTYIYTYIPIHTYIYRPTYTYIFIHTHTHKYIPTCIHIYAYIDKHIHRHPPTASLKKIRPFCI